MQKLLRAVRRHWFRVFISLLIVSFFWAHVQGLARWGVIDSLELLAYDARLNFVLKQQPPRLDQRLVIVDIDEKSLGILGRWPWKRNVIGDLVNTLFDYYKINVLGFDVMFPEADASSGLNTLEYLAQDTLKHNQAFLDALETLRVELNFDQYFANSLQNRRAILGYAMLEDPQRSISGELPAAAFSLAEFADIPIQPYGATGYAGNLKHLADASLTAGYFSVYPDSDSLTRRAPLLHEYDGKLYESLALAVARTVLDSPLKLEFSAASADNVAPYLRLHEQRVPLDRRLQALIPYQGKTGSFSYVSASDVLFRAIDPAELQGAIVLFGTTAKGLFDLRATPIEEVYPGVEIHANLIAGLLDNSILRQDHSYFEVYQMLLSGLLMIALMLLFSPLWTMAIAFLYSFVLLWINLYFWQVQQLIIPIAPTMLMLTALFFFNLGYGYFVESYNKRQLAGRFGQYVPPQLVNEMSENPQADFSMEGDSREMTVLFSDVRGFTSISEGLNPKQLSQLMNTFLTPMTHVIHNHRGTIDKYMGDAIMAFWGAPLRDEQHARHALNAALEMTKKLEELQPIFAEHGWPPIKVGVGLNTGVMNVGNMGSEFRIAYTVLGDAVNLGSRLEGLTKLYGVQIIVSESTRAAVPDYAYRELDRVRVKGKDLPITIFEPLGEKQTLTAEQQAEISTYENALQAYRQQDWQTAIALFVELAEVEPTRKLYSIYLERIEHFQQSPPEQSWDGVFTHTSK